MKFSTATLLLLFFIGTHSSGAVLEDSITVDLPIETVIRYVQAGVREDGNQKWMVPDSNLIRLSSFNIGTKGHFNSLGNLGSALDPQIFNADNEILPFIGLRSYDPYILRHEDLRYYRSNKRYTQLDYHLGTFKEQEIRLLHSQNVLKTWSIGLDFHRLGVRDFTINSDTYHNQLALFTWYESPNSRYNIFASAIWNTFKNQVNGGLRNDSLFDLGNTDNLGLKGLAVNLFDAKHQVRNHEFALQNSYDFIPKNDSGESKKHKINSFQFIQASSFESGAFAYSDGVSDSLFYDHFFNSEETYDSLHYYDLKNSAGFFVPQSDSSASIFFKTFSSSVEVEYQWFDYSQRDKFYLSNYALKANLFSKENDSTFNLKASGNYIFAGDNRGLYNLNAIISSPQYKVGSLFANVHLVRREADLMYQQYYSNHFIWNNKFSEIQSQSFSAGVNNRKYKFQLEALIHHIKNFVYSGNDAMPAQFDGSLEISQLRLLKNFSLGIWHLDNDIFIQKSGREDFLQLPSTTSYHALYIQDNFFKKALKAQIGFQVNFNSSYFSRGFVPATAFFINQSEKKTGGYALIDLFVHLKIKSARIFLKIENIGDGLVGDRYYLSPAYPQPGRTLKFGLSWRFYDM